MNVLKVVTVEGSVGIGSCQILKNRILSVFGEADHVILNCECAADVDLSFVQLVLSAKQSAAKLGKKIQLAENVSLSVRKALTLSGIIPYEKMSSKEIELSFDQFVLAGGVKYYV